MTIFEAIIHCQTEKMKELIESGNATANDLEPESFTGKDGNTIYRKKRKTALQVAESLKRNEIVEYLAQFSYHPYFLFDKEFKMLRPLVKGEQITNHNYLFIANTELEKYLSSRNCIE